jgi:hypothetical protein
MKTKIQTKIFISIFIFFLGITNLSAQNFWSPTSFMNPPSAYVPAISVIDGGTVLASNWAYGLWRTTNNGMNWFQTSLSGSRIYNITEGPNSSNFAISTATTGPKIYRSMDNGLSWLEVYHAAHTNNYFFGGGIVFMDENTAVAALSFTLGPTIGDIGVDIVRSTDGGATWTWLGMINGWGAANAIKKLDDGRILVATSLAGLWQSTNNGSFWTQVTSFPPIFTNSIATNSKGHIFIGRSTAAGYTTLMFRSVNNGASWDQFLNEAVGNANGGELMDIYIDKNDKIFVSLVKNGPTEKKIYSSTNNGDNWSEIMSGMPSSAYIYALTGNSQGVLFAGTNDQGVFKGNENISSIGNGNEHPEIFTLQQNFPNPFNPETTIKYSLASQGKVTLSVFDVTGKNVKTLVNSFQPQGEYNITLNGSDLTSGIYFYKIEINSGGNTFNETKKMMLVK